MNTKQLQKNESTRNLAVLGLLAAPWVGFLAVALRPNPKQMWAQRWPTILFVGLYQIALDRCVELEGLENLPASGPVILAGNHINNTAMDAMLMGSKILIERGGLPKFVSQTEHTDPWITYLIRLMGNPEGVILPISRAKTTQAMIEFLRDPHTFNREQPILGIFPAGCSDTDIATHLSRPWHTSAAVAAIETGVPVVPFYVEGLPRDWGPTDMLKAVARSIMGGKAFDFKVRLGPPIYPRDVVAENPYTEMTERIRQAVRELAVKSGAYRREAEAAKRN